MVNKKSSRTVTPVIQGMHLTPIGHGLVLLEPGEGLDPTDISTYLVPLLQFLHSRKAKRLLYDLRSIPVIDEVYYAWLVRVHNACYVQGVELVAVNIKPQAAYALSLILEHKPPFTCVLDVNRVREQ